MVLIKNGKISEFSEKNKENPLEFHIENDRVSLKPIATSNGLYFCCDSYIGEIVDTGNDIICVHENIYFLYNNKENIAKFIDLQKFSEGKSQEFCKNKENDEKMSIKALKDVCYYYIEKKADFLVLITKNCKNSIFCCFFFFLLKFCQISSFSHFSRAIQREKNENNRFFPQRLHRKHGFLCRNRRFTL